VCGNGVVEGTEQCDLGPANQERPALVARQLGGPASIVSPFGTTATSSQFYNYYSSSAHTGLEAMLSSRVLLHRDLTTGNLSLVMVHGIDYDTSGQNQPQSKVSFALSGVPTGATVVLSDDGGELTATGPGAFQANWSFQSNTDGGVIGTLTFPGDWTILVTPTFTQGIGSWSYVDGSGKFIHLNLTGALALRAFSTPSKCRTNCTVPKCGDSIVDGGEVCDDGNTVGGDGCAADCKSLK
jgi:cysteine-rich repeat protein